jgi:dTDP-4-amino-4,6-dideoxygalactose transaminase
MVSNGTIALQLALRALDITEGEVITTAFSYVATVSAILWERCRPVFVDIRKDNYCIDAEKIEAAITSRTKAIMPVHVFGFACDVDRINAIANKHKLKVIYDGAHAFGARHNHRSLLAYGDISTCSFHATKPFHTIEGGAIITPDNALGERVELIKRFGHNGNTHYMLGINAKASEFQAAMGLCNLKYIDGIIEDRRSVSALYGELLGDTVTKPDVPSDGRNYAYYPVLFQTEAQLLVALTAMEKQDIHPRRYFYPALNTLPYIQIDQQCPIAEDISRRVLCLPFYGNLEKVDVEKISRLVKVATGES